MPESLSELLAGHEVGTPPPPLPPDYIQSTVRAARRRAVRRRAMHAAAGTGVASVAALALVVGIGALGTGGPRSGDSVAGSAAGRTQAGPGDEVRVPAGGSGRGTQVHLSDAKALLVSASLTAAEARRPAPRADQFIHTRFQAVNGGTSTVGESWNSVDGSRRGYILQASKDGRGLAGYHSLANPEPSLTWPTYTFLTTLPTDPDRLYAMIRDEVDGIVSRQQGKVRDPDQYAFQLIGDLLPETTMVPELGAALYRAAARIPGVTLVPRAVDAAGRPGVAVARTDDQGEVREEWIFDRSTLDYRGKRRVDLAAHRTVMDVAILGQDVVDSPPPQADEPDPAPAPPSGPPPEVGGG